MLTTHNIDIQAMLVRLTLPFYDFCGFRSVDVNSVYKLQFFTFILYMCICAKFGWNRCSSFENMNVFRFREFGLKTPIHAPKLRVFGGDDP